MVQRRKGRVSRSQESLCTLTVPTQAALGVPTELLIALQQRVRPSMSMCSIAATALVAEV